MTLGDLRRRGLDLLRKAKLDNHENEAVWLLEHALGVSRTHLHSEPDRQIGRQEADRALEFVTRRARREPLQYLLGTQEFRGLEFLVTPAVLIPRVDTECLVEEALSVMGRREASVVADIGTGTGCVAISVAVASPRSQVWATDLSAAALEVARANCRRHHVDHQVTCLEGDLIEPLRPMGLEGRIDLMLSNPPYIAADEWSDLQPEVGQFEPRLALAGGPDGLAFHRRLIRTAPGFLRPGGWLLMEVGAGQANAVTCLAAALGAFDSIRVRRDRAGIERVVCAGTRRAAPH
jgi:release factor glutamine methyltransferase